MEHTLRQEALNDDLEFAYLYPGPRWESARADHQWSRRHRQRGRCSIRHAARLLTGQHGGHLGELHVCTAAASGQRGLTIASRVLLASSPSSHIPCCCHLL